MQDYQPISLTDLCNVNAEIIGANIAPTLGQQTFHGLPFHISEGEKCFLGFGEGVNTAPIQVPVNASPKRVSLYIDCLSPASLKANRSAG